MKKRIWLFSKIWPFFRFVTVKLNFHQIFYLLVFLGKVFMPLTVTVTPWYYNLILL